MTTEGTSLATRAETLPEGPSLAHMMEVAIQQGPQGVEALERLAALMERETDRRARMAFFEAMAAFQSEVGPLHKTKGVSFDERVGAKIAYHYTPLDEVERTVRPVLAGHGLHYTFDSALDGHAITASCSGVDET